MQQIVSPWPGLAALAPRVHLWPVLEGIAAAAGAALSGVPSVRLEQLGAAGLPPRYFGAIAEAEEWGELPDGVVAMTPFDPRWPRALIGLDRGPVFLTFEGELSLLQRTSVAVVGARACTPYGRDWARRIAGAVALAGGVVVSGLAAGVDVSAHGAAPGATIAVLGQGLSAAMPAWQRRIREDLLGRGGLVISEFPSRLHAGAHTFPIRNRIIAGLSRAVVVVEAGERSGTRNTAGHALRFGREVLAVPGRVDAPASAGCLDLIEEGATMIRDVHTVLSTVGLDREPPAESAGQRLFRCLSTPKTPEELVQLSRIPYREVMVELGMLELTGRLIRLPGGKYRTR